MAVSSKTWDYAGYLVASLWLAKQVYSTHSSGRKSRDATPPSPTAAKPGSPTSSSTAGYKTFYPDLGYLCRIVFPTWKCRESLLGYSFLLVLLLRTFLSVVVADVDGYMVKQLINRDKQHVAQGVAVWLLISLPSSFVNALIKYLQARLAIGIRKRVTEHVRDLYFDNEAYFRVSHLDRRVGNPEHAMTEDVAQWADRLADLASSFGKPLVDLVFFSVFLIKSLGFMNQFAASVVVWESGKFLKYVRPNYSDLVQQRGSLEAALRFQHTRVITASEEIAFCKGDKREKAILTGYFDKIYSFTTRMLRSQIPYHTFEDFLTKYVWNVVGLVQVAFPLLKGNRSAGDSAKYFITMRRLMIRNGDATERIMVGIKDLHEFAGYTKRVMDMIRVFKEQKDLSLTQKGTVVTASAADDASIIVKDLPIVTPAGDLLIAKMNLTLKVGDRLLILGPNGCGKSSLFRILCGLWPMTGGEIQKPLERTDLYFLPQKPYLVQGTFRDQIIYPFTKEELTKLGQTDDDIRRCIAWSLLTPVVEAHGGLDAVKEWGEVLSGGEKQRVGIARIFFHRPKWAILDECSSAINVEAEADIFAKLIECRIGIVTISHRHTLFKFHNKVLTFDGVGGYNFNDVLEETSLIDLSKKKELLIKQLQDTVRELGEDWPKPVKV